MLKFTYLLLLFFYIVFTSFLTVVTSDECNINACDVIDKIKDDIDIDNVKSHLINLERRLRSLEQPGKNNTLKVDIKC